MNRHDECNASTGSRHLLIKILRQIIFKITARGTMPALTVAGCFDHLRRQGLIAIAPGASTPFAT